MQNLLLVQIPAAPMRNGFLCYPSARHVSLFVCSSARRNLQLKLIAQSIGRIFVGILCWTFPMNSCIKCNQIQLENIACCDEKSRESEREREGDKESWCCMFVFPMTVFVMLDYCSLAYNDGVELMQIFIEYSLEQLKLIWVFMWYKLRRCYSLLIPWTFTYTKSALLFSH